MLVFINERDLKRNVIPAIGDISCEALCQSKYEGCKQNCINLARMCRTDRCWSQVEDCHSACDGSKGFCMSDCRWWPW
jgi:hypothetical protein